MIPRSLLILALSFALPATADAAHATFALIVTNNHGSALGRPDLQYADDDGARYYELFQTFAPAEHVTLLTDFDRDTARLFPQLVPLAQPPTRANVDAAAAAIAARVADAERAGDTADFYFIFAGHGDVDRGRGFVELADGELDGAGLEALIARVHATRAHVILDSCNSFFVLGARRPGGHRFATPVDAAAGLAARLPNVGVFVSTSAEAEVFEWSELQSGVFSHAVRSGLAGAADANGDGIVSYDELRAFVDTATADVKNAAFRPKVYARGPGGDDQAALAPVAIAGDRVALDPARAIRATVRDRDELPWIDVNKEAGAAIVLHVPPGVDGATIDGRDLCPAGSAAEWRCGSIAEHGGSGAGATQIAARGADDVFRPLFARPFGPHALAQYDADRAAEPPPVFGVSHDDVLRLGDLLGNLDDEQRERRELAGSSLLAFGGGLGIYYSLADGMSPTVRGIGLASSAFVVGFGAYQLLRVGSYERLRAQFDAELAAGRDPAHVVAEIDTELHAVARAARSGRMHQRLAGGVALLLGGGILITDHFNHGAYTRDYPNAAAGYTAVAALGALTMLYSIPESPIERTARIWDNEPALASPPPALQPAHLGIAPVSGGAMLSLGGSL